MVRPSIIKGIEGAIILTLVGSCGILPITVVSDVPCFRLEWDQALVSAFRTEFADGGRLLFAAQTEAQFVEDRGDDLIPHLTVFAFDAEMGTAEIVDEEVWDSAEGRPVFPDAGGGSEPFIIQGVGRSQLLYEGNAVPVAGGTAVGIFPSFTSEPTVAILSTTGVRSAPLFSNAAAAGQHYHQLFSEETGEVIGQALRLGLGDGKERILVGASWTTDNRHVVYRSGSTFCIADGIAE